MNGIPTYSFESGSFYGMEPSPGTSGGSDDGLLSMMTNIGGAPSPGVGTTAKSTGALCKVQSQSSPLAAKSPVMSPSAPTQSKKSPQSGNGSGGPTDDNRQKTDLFLSQFQAQMSQVKSAMDELMQKSGGSPQQNSPGGSASPRGGASRRRIPQQTPVASGVTYQSQISMNGLKLKIKKSPKAYKKRGPKAGSKKGRRKRRRGDEDDDSVSDSDEFSDEPRAKISRAQGNDEKGGGEPSGWGDQLPEEALEKIFSHAVEDTGSIPLLVRVSRVSRLWRKVANDPKLWTDVDLSSARVKHVYRTERNLCYFLEHRFFHAKTLNLGGWSSALTPQAIEVLVRCCKELESLGVSSCQKLTGPNLKRITEELNCLKKLDLSTISVRYFYETDKVVSLNQFGKIILDFIFCNCSLHITPKVLQLLLL